MDAFRFIWDFLFGTIIRSFNYFVSWFENATEHGFHIDKSGMITTSLISLIFCGSAITAMTIAEFKNRNRWFHFAIGFLVPVIYPAVLFFAFPKVGVKKQEEDEEEEEHEKARAVPDSDFQTHADGTGILPIQGINQEYFKKISKDEEGNLLGPYVMELDDAQILEVEYILESLPTAVSVQIGHGEVGKKIRLPYSKIKDCKTKERWLEESQHQAFEEEEEGFYEEEGVYEEGNYYEEEGEN